MKFLHKASLFIFTSSFLFIAAARGQVVGGTIGGVVRDSSGATLGGATVVVRQVDTGTSRTVTTSADGFFNAPSLPVGHYTVTVEHQGFAPQTQTNLSLAIG